MDFTIEDEYFEVKDYTSILPDNVLLHILSELSWRDILNAKLLSKRFYSIIHKNYHRLERKKTLGVSIKYDENHNSHPFHVQLVFDCEESVNFQDIPFGTYMITNKIQSGEELISFLKMFDMSDINLEVPIADNLDVFDIMNRSFQVGTEIRLLKIPKLMEKDFKGFRTFVRKLSSVSLLEIDHVCSSSTETKDVYELLSLSSFKATTSFTINP
uniref:F-box domain-containing protein n=1 Tax=Strongyloides papillosus TaxID=174720 RepID=A0A0N5CCV6_STREA